MFGHVKNLHVMITSRTWRARLLAQGSQFTRKKWKIGRPTIARCGENPRRARRRRRAKRRRPKAESPPSPERSPDTRQTCPVTSQTATRVWRMFAGSSAGILPRNSRSCFHAVIFVKIFWIIFRFFWGFSDRPRNLRFRSSLLTRFSRFLPSILARFFPSYSCLFEVASMNVDTMQYEFYARFAFDGLAILFYNSMLHSQLHIMVWRKVWRVKSHE